MFDANMLKKLINEKNFFEARNYLVEQIDELIDKNIPKDSFSDGVLNLSNVRSDIAGIMLTYHLILEDDSSPEEFVVTRLMDCYSAFKEKFST